MMKKFCHLEVSKELLDESSIFFFAPWGKIDKYVSLYSTPSFMETSRMRICFCCKELNIVAFRSGVVNGPTRSGPDPKMQARTRK